MACGEKRQRTCVSSSKLSGYAALAQASHLGAARREPSRASLRERARAIQPQSVCTTRELLTLKRTEETSACVCAKSASTNLLVFFLFFFYDFVLRAKNSTCCAKRRRSDERD